MLVDIIARVIGLKKNQYTIQDTRGQIIKVLDHFVK